MRSKEFAHDYRYFPDPDLVPVQIDDEMLERLKLELPEFPEVRAERFVKEFGIPVYDAGVLTAEREVSDYFEAVVRACSDAKAASNWVMGEVLRMLKERNISVASFSVPPERLGGLISLIGGGTISNTIAKQVFERMLETGGDPGAIVEEEGLAQVSDTAEIEKIVQSVIDANSGQVEQYRSGKTRVFGFFVGQCMKVMKGKANPVVVNEILKQKLEG